MVNAMETETTIVGHSANGLIRLAVLLPNSDIDAGCYTQYHSGYFIAGETRVRLREAILANYGGYELGDIITRDYGEGYTIYTVEITPKMPLETRAACGDIFPLAGYRQRLMGRLWRESAICRYNPFILSPLWWRGISEKTNNSERKKVHNEHE